MSTASDCHTFFRQVASIGLERGHNYSSPLSAGTDERMKINQLFVQHVTIDMLNLIIDCFGLNGLHDRRMFTKADMRALNTVGKMNELVPQLSDFYLPCKARIYLRNIGEKKCITILKQTLKLHRHLLLTRERNTRHIKVTRYQIVSEQERTSLHSIEVLRSCGIGLAFD